MVMAAIFFDGVHFFVSGTPLRAAVVSRTGEKVYQGVFSVVSLVGWLVTLNHCQASPVIESPDASSPDEQATRNSNVRQTIKGIRNFLISVSVVLASYEQEG